LKEYNSLDECIDDALNEDFNLVSTRDHTKRLAKKRKTAEERPIAFVRLNTRRGSPKPITIRALLDSGASSTLVVEKHVKKLKMRKPSATTTWNTPAGTFGTKGTVKTQFILPELQDSRMIEWDVHVAKDLGTYDMIIGRDILEDLGIDIKFSTKTIDWDDASMPFKDIEQSVQESYHIQEPIDLEELFEASKILDNDYAKADLKGDAEAQTQLSEEEQLKLYNLFKKCEDLFDGTLGKWTHDDYHLELKEGAKPHHARAFPVPRVHYDTLKKEVERLCAVGVLKRVNRSEWAAPTFIVPKKDGKVRFVSDF
jgi:hypothetical protein